MERCLLCRMWKPVWKWLEEVDRLTGQRIRLGALCRTCSCHREFLHATDESPSHAAMA